MPGMLTPPGCDVQAKGEWEVRHDDIFPLGAQVRKQLVAFNLTQARGYDAVNCAYNASVLRGAGQRAGMFHEAAQTLRLPFSRSFLCLGVCVSCVDLLVVLLSSFCVCVCVCVREVYWKVEGGGMARSR